MRVVIDLNPVLQNRHSGFYAVGKGMLLGFSQIDNAPEIVLFYSGKFEQQAGELLSEFDCNVETKVTPIKKRWLEKLYRKLSFPAMQAFTGPFDIFHCIHHMIPPTKGKPTVMTVHDLRRYRLPNLYTASKLGAFEQAIKKANHFIAVSQSTKDDLCDVFGITPDRVDVVHLAADSKFVPASQQQKNVTKNKLSELFGTNIDKFLLAFSSPDQRKNVSGIIKAFTEAMSEIDKNIKLVVVGKTPKNDTTFDELAQKGLSDRIVLTGPIDNVAEVMQCAYGLVFATLYEGFGVPIVEAFNCDVPVITSNVSSMPEIAKDAALIADPNNTESVSKAMIELCNDENKRQQLIEMGRIRRQDFSWKKHAEQTLKVYEKLSCC